MQMAGIARPQVIAGAIRVGKIVSGAENCTWFCHKLIEQMRVVASTPVHAHILLKIK